MRFHIRESCTCLWICLLWTQAYHLADSPLDNQLGTPEAGQAGGVEHSSWGCRDSCLEDTVVFGVDAAAWENDRADLFAVVADLAASVVAVYCAHWSSIVSCANDFVVLYDDSTYCFFQAGCPFFQYHANIEKVFIVAWAKLSDDVFVMFYIYWTILATMAE